MRKNLFFKKNLMLFCLISWIIVCFILLGANTEIAESYSIESLGIIGMATDINDRDINDPEMIVGAEETIYGNRAFLYTDGAKEELGVLGCSPYSCYSSAYAINKDGHIAGTSTINSSYLIITRAFLYKDGVMEDLGTLGEGDPESSNGFGINDSDQIVGSAETSSGDYHAFLYDNVMHDLGTLGGLFSEAWGINNSDQIVGWAETSSGEYHAFLYDGAMHDLGTLGGSFSFASEINNSGQIVGYAETSSGEYHAFLYDDAMHDLGTLGGSFSQAVGINDSGQIVGWAETSSGEYHAFLYDGAIHDLGTLGGPDSQAWGINNLGQIVGWAETSSEDRYAVIWNPVPVSEPPVADPGGPYIGFEGSPIAFDASGSYDPDGDPLQYRWDFDNDGVWDTDWLNDPTASHTWNDDWSGTVTVEVSDGDSTDTATTTVNVNNVAPTVGPIVAPIDPLQVGTGISVSATFNDPGTLDTHTAIWDWGDDSTSSGTVGSGTVTGNHTYTTLGVYTISVTVTDDDGDSGGSIFQYVIIYDPEGGFVTGGGWIMSPEGAYTPDPSLTGKANFGFVSKYKKGATVPTGETEFNFKVADMNFHSDSYDWLVVNQNDSNAQFKGSGTINGEGDYHFMLWAGDGTTDTFRIKIWEEDENGNETVTYDNGSDQPIDGGNIVIHE